MNAYRASALACSFFTSAMVVPLYADPGPSFQLREARRTIAIRSGGTAEVELGVIIPLQSYVVIGHQSVLSTSAVTSFSVVSSGWNVVLDRAPRGTVRNFDHVLLGKGRKAAGIFRLKIFEVLGRSPGPRIHEVKLAIQTASCNAQNSRCEPMQTQFQTLGIKITAGRLAIKSRVSSNIHWLVDADAAYEKARSTGQNLFVIITAPGWCGTCIYMEKNTFPDQEVERVLNGKFVPLRLVWDKQPPKDLGKFFAGGSVPLPSMYIYSSDRKRLTELQRGTNIRKAGLLHSLKAFEKIPAGSGGGNASITYVYELPAVGAFSELGGGKWKALGREGEQSYSENRRDENFIVVRNDRTGVYVALPLTGENGYVYRNEKWEPTPGKRTQSSR